MNRDISQRLEESLIRESSSALAYEAGHRKYWYFITDFYCPVCGHSETYKDRMYHERPADWDDRHEIIESYDYCNA